MKNLRLLMTGIVACVATLSFSTSSYAVTKYSVIIPETERRSLWQERFNDPTSVIHEGFQRHMDILSETKPFQHEDAMILDSGIMSFPLRYALIKKAKHSIVMSTFSTYSGKNKGIHDPMTEQMVNMLIDAKNRGVFVLMITDGTAAVLSQSNGVIKKLRDHGIRVQNFNPIGSNNRTPTHIGGAFEFMLKGIQGRKPLDNKWHEKTLVVDGEYVLSGGLNWGELYGRGNSFTAATRSSEAYYNHPLVKELGVTYQPQWSHTPDTAWRDTDILIKGNIARTALKTLLKDQLLLQVMEDGGGKDKYKDATLEEYQKAEYLFEKHFNSDPEFSKRMNWHESPRYLANNVRYITQRPFVERDDALGKHKRRVAYAEANNLYIANKKDSRKLVNLRITDYYINAINKAKKQILWGCHSNRPTDKILEALKEAAERGVKIYIIGNSREAAKTLPEKGIFMYPLASMKYEKILKAGGGNIKLFEWQAKVDYNGQTLRSGAFHSKVLSIDGVLTSIGSFNVSRASFRKHAEGTFVIQDLNFARDAEKTFQKDLMFTKEVTLESLEEKRKALRERSRDRRRIRGGRR